MCSSTRPQVRMQHMLPFPWQQERHAGFAVFFMLLLRNHSPYTRRGLLVTTYHSPTRKGSLLYHSLYTRRGSLHYHSPTMRDSLLYHSLYTRRGSLHYHSPTRRDSLLYHSLYTRRGSLHYHSPTRRDSLLYHSLTRKGSLHCALFARRSHSPSRLQKRAHISAT
jgi:hypothetical protein